jgi:hypothetical protein
MTPLIQAPEAEEEKDQMRSLMSATLVAAGLAAGTLAANSADMPVKIKRPQEPVIDHRKQRDSDPAATRLLFEEFLEWLKSR